LKETKGQAAIEFLTTYGWAISVMLVVISSFSYLGIVDLDSFTPERCVAPGGFVCDDFNIYLAQDNFSFDLRFRNQISDEIVFLNSSDFLVDKILIYTDSGVIVDGDASSLSASFNFGAIDQFGNSINSPRNIVRSSYRVDIEDFESDLQPGDFENFYVDVFYKKAGSDDSFASKATFKVAGIVRGIEELPDNQFTLPPDHFTNPRADPNCYTAPANTVGQWPGCEDMLIVNWAAMEYSSYPINGGVDRAIEVDGVEYTYGDSEHNIFTGQLTTLDLGVDASDRSDFNADIGYWDVSSVYSMFESFRSFSSFNQNISSWDVSNVKSMENMFYGALVFNRDLSGWDVSGVNDMSGMFEHARNFDQDLSGWDVSGVTDMSRMFMHTREFNQDLSGWDVSGVTDMSRMFFDASSFDQDISGWDTSSVNDMSYMFYGYPSSFNQDISNWCVVSIPTEPDWFESAMNENFKPDWGESCEYNGCYSLQSAGLIGQEAPCEDMLIVNQYMLKDAVSDETYTISGPDGIDYTLGFSSHNVFTGAIKDMQNLFHDAVNFNEDIAYWDVSNAQTMSGMFDNAGVFNRDLSGWDVSNVSDMSSMFERAWDFNQDISGWDVSGVSDMNGMFRNAEVFDQDLSGWDVSGVSDMSYMFHGAHKFNQPIGSWNVSSVNSMRRMFGSANSFDQDLSGWDVSGVSDMSHMFTNAEVFNQDISGWDVSGVVTMGFMFTNAEAFNQDISGWDVSSVGNMYNMFKGAQNFNQPIGSWNVSSVTYMPSVFWSATSFNQDLSNWCVEDLSDPGSFWAYNSPLQSNTNFHPNWGAPCNVINSNLGSMFVPGGTDDIIKSQEGLSSSLELTADASNMTFIVWIRPDWNGRPSQVFFNLGREASDLNIRAWYFGNLNRLIFQMTGNSYGSRKESSFALHTTGNNAITGVNSATLGWNKNNLGNSNCDGFIFLAFTYKAPGSVGSDLKSYWNAQELERTTGIINDINMVYDGSEFIDIGRAFGSQQNHLSAYVHNLQIYDKVLSESDLQDIYNGGIPKDESQRNGLLYYVMPSENAQNPQVIVGGSQMSYIGNANHSTDYDMSC
jgi:surface protein